MPRVSSRWPLALAIALSLEGAWALHGQEKPPGLPVANSTAPPPSGGMEILLDKIEDQVALTFVDRHEITFDRPGVLQFVVEEAEAVTAGQVIARLRNETAAAAVAVAAARVLNQAEIDSARKQAEAAALEYQAAKAANERNPKTANPVYPQTAIDRLRLASETATIEIERFVKEHAVNERARDQAQAELDSLEVKAPRDGLVTRAFKQTGEGVQVGETVVEIVSTRRIRVEAEIDLAIAPRLKVGNPVTLLVDFPGSDRTLVTEKYETQLKFIDPTVDPSSLRVRIWAEVDNPHGKLREGLPARLLLRSL